MFVYLILFIKLTLKYVRSFFFSSRRRHTIWPRDWSSDVCSSDLAGLAGSRFSGRAVGARFEIDIAEAPFASPREQCDLFMLGEVGDRFSGLHVRDHGAGGHAQYDIIGPFPVALGTAPALAVPRAVNAREAIFDKGRSE